MHGYNIIREEKIRMRNIALYTGGQTVVYNLLWPFVPFPLIRRTPVPSKKNTNKEE